MSPLPLSYRRRPTRRVMIGAVGVGANEPIRVQSMTTTDTGDWEATAQQSLRLFQAGCEIIRVTVPNMQDAAALEPLRRRLEELGVTAPLVADIHFNPHAAMVAADFVEKVRVNPGNYADVKKFAVREYSDDQYAGEIDRIREKFAPLVEKCKRLGRAMRIGTNHGSLSDRIMNRHGDTPLGMVESALEFVRLCEEQDYRDLVISMKSSNPFVAVEAYRLLAERMALEGMDYPFHLGVTEAGNGEDGRVKSAIGIGSLLADGIGDTIRVSLTEDPVHEVPVAFALAAPYNAREADASRETIVLESAPHRRRATATSVGGCPIGGEARVATFVDIGPLGDGGDAASRLRELVAPPGVDEPLADIALVEVSRAEVAAFEKLRPARWTPQGRRPLAALVGPDVIAHAHALASVAAACDLLFARPGASEPQAWRGEVATAGRAAREAGCRFGGWVDEHAALVPKPGPKQLAESAFQLVNEAIEATGAEPIVAIVPSPEISPVAAVRAAVAELDFHRFDAPLLLVDRSGAAPGADPLLEGATRLGGCLVDGIGDAILVRDRPPGEAHAQALSVLQATRQRMTRPDYISCPSCGRTLFDLEEVTARIKGATQHLKGVKIAIMGCIVNGPGEMADADFGYVGSSPGKINLYVGKDCVLKNVPAAEADDRLISLIKDHGRWVEPIAVG